MSGVQLCGVAVERFVPCVVIIITEVRTISVVPCYPVTISYHRQPVQSARCAALNRNARYESPGVTNRDGSDTKKQKTVTTKVEL